MDVAVAAEERFLHGIGGRIAVVDHAHDEREEVILVERDKLVERVQVARDRALDERAVAHVGRVIEAPRSLASIWQVRARIDFLGVGRHRIADDLLHESELPTGGDAPIASDDQPGAESSSHTLAHWTAASTDDLPALSVTNCQIRGFGRPGCRFEGSKWRSQRAPSGTTGHDARRQGYLRSGYG